MDFLIKVHVINSPLTLSFLDDSESRVQYGGKKKEGEITDL